MAVVLPQLLEVLLQVAPLLRRRRRRSQRVRANCENFLNGCRLTYFTENEESDEDMGFGLFD